MPDERDINGKNEEHPEDAPPSPAPKEKEKEGVGQWVQRQLLRNVLPWTPGGMMAFPPGGMEEEAEEKIPTVRKDALKDVVGTEAEKRDVLNKVADVLRRRSAGAFPPETVGVMETVAMMNNETVETRTRMTLEKCCSGQALRRGDQILLSPKTIRVLADLQLLTERAAQEITVQWLMEFSDEERRALRTALPLSMQLQFPDRKSKDYIGFANAIISDSDDIEHRYLREHLRQELEQKRGKSVTESDRQALSALREERSVERKKMQYEAAMTTIVLDGFLNANTIQHSVHTLTLIRERQPKIWEQIHHSYIAEPKHHKLVALTLTSLLRGKSAHIEEYLARIETHLKQKDNVGIAAVESLVALRTTHITDRSQQEKLGKIFLQAWNDAPDPAARTRLVNVIDVLVCNGQRPLYESIVNGMKRDKLRTSYLENAFSLGHSIRGYAATGDLRTYVQQCRKYFDGDEESAARGAAQSLAVLDSVDTVALATVKKELVRLFEDALLGKFQNEYVRKWFVAQLPVLARTDFTEWKRITNFMLAHPDADRQEHFWIARSLEEIVKTKDINKYIEECELLLIKQNHSEAALQGILESLLSWKGASLKYPDIRYLCTLVELGLRSYTVDAYTAAMNALEVIAEMDNQKWREFRDIAVKYRAHHSLVAQSTTGLLRSVPPQHSLYLDECDRSLKQKNSTHPNAYTVGILHSLLEAPRTFLQDPQTRQRLQDALRRLVVDGHASLKGEALSILAIMAPDEAIRLSPFVTKDIAPTLYAQMAPDFSANPLPVVDIPSADQSMFLNAVSPRLIDGDAGIVIAEVLPRLHTLRQSCKQECKFDDAQSEEYWKLNAGRFAQILSIHPQAGFGWIKKMWHTAPPTEPTEIAPFHIIDKLSADASQFYTQFLGRVTDVTPALLERLLIVHDYAIQAGFEKNHIDALRALTTNGAAISRTTVEQVARKSFLHTIAYEMHVREEIPDVLIAQWDNRYLLRLLDALKKEQNRQRFRFIIKTALLGDFGKIIRGEEVAQPTHYSAREKSVIRRLQERRKQFQQLLESKGLNFEIWNGFTGTRSIRLDHTRNDSALFAQWRKACAELMGQQQNIHSMEVFIQSLLAEQQWSLKDGDIVDAKGQILNVSHIPTLVSMCRKVIEKASTPRLTQLRVQFEDAETALSHLATEKRKVPSVLQARLWKREPGHDLFIGDRMHCCIAMNAERSGAMADYLTDVGTNVIELVDGRGNAVALASCFVGETNAGSLVLVIDGMEISNDYAHYGFAIRDQLLDLAREYAQSIGTEKGGIDAVVMAAAFLGAPRPNFKKEELFLRKFGGKNIWGGQFYDIFGMLKNVDPTIFRQVPVFVTSRLTHEQQGNAQQKRTAAQEAQQIVEAERKKDKATRDFERILGEIRKRLMEKEIFTGAEIEKMVNEGVFGDEIVRVAAEERTALEGLVQEDVKVMVEKFRVDPGMVYRLGNVEVLGKIAVELGVKVGDRTNASEMQEDILMKLKK